MTGYALAAVITVCLAALLIAIVWAAVRINQKEN